jgi:hypothetical protein
VTLYSSRSLFDLDLFDLDLFDLDLFDLDLFDLDLFDCKFPFDLILICTNIDSLVRLIDSSTDDSPSFV